MIEDLHEKIEYVKNAKRYVVVRIWILTVALLPFVFFATWLLLTYLAFSSFRSCPPVKIEFFDFFDFFAYHIFRNAMEFDEELFVGAGAILWSFSVSFYISVLTNRYRKHFGWAKLYPAGLIALSLAVFFIMVPIAQPWQPGPIAVAFVISVLIYSMLFWRIYKALFTRLQNTLEGLNEIKQVKTLLDETEPNVE